MEFLKAAKRRSLWSEVAYITLNVMLVLAILGVVWAIESPIPAFGLVLLSKWRIFAVRPRYWFAHVQSNMVDIIVSLSLVVLLYAASGSWIAQVGIALLYVVWLLALKPRSKRLLIVIQAAVSLFVGTTAIALVSYDWYASVVVLLFWIIGYSTGRHVLAAYGQEAHISFLSLIWGFIIAEIGWLTYHWTIAYDLIGVGAIKLPQVAIIVTFLSFLAERVYASYSKNGKIRSNDVVLPVLLSVSVIALLLVFFNGLTTSLN